MTSLPLRTPFKRLFRFRPEQRDEELQIKTLPINSDVTDGEQSLRLYRIYETVSKNIERENSLLNFRILWAVFLSAGMLTAETFIANYTKEYYQARPSIHLVGQAAIILLSVLAIFFCYMSKEGVLAAQAQMLEIKEAYNRYAPTMKDFGFPRPFGDKERHDTGDYNAIAFPIALMTLWLLLGVGQCGIFVYHLKALPHDTTLSRCIAAPKLCLSIIAKRLDSAQDAQTKKAP